MDTAAAQAILNRLINVAAYDMSTELIADARTALSYLVERASATEWHLAREENKPQVSIEKENGHGLD